MIAAAFAAPTATGGFDAPGGFELLPQQGGWLNDPD
jgi:hypothetical protein